MGTKKIIDLDQKKTLPKNRWTLVTLKVEPNQVDIVEETFFQEGAISIDLKDAFEGEVKESPVYEKIEDESLLKNYAVEAKKAVEKFGGKFLIRGGDKITTEGKEFLRTAVIEFSSFDVAKNFFYSNEYQSAHTILKDTVIRHHQIIKGN